MKIFLSYSSKDMELVRSVADHVRAHSEVFFWEESNVPGANAWESIFEWIDSCDLVLVLITGNAVERAMAVGNEVGRAKAKLKTVIPLVSIDVPSTELGCLSGITYQAVDTRDPGPALARIAELIRAHKQKIERDQGLLFLLGVVALVWMSAQK